LQDAWTWEHQALVRARPIGGAKRLSKAFAEARHRVLSQQRQTEQLATDVIEMRNKMRVHLGSGKAAEAGVFNLKQDAGGIVDIEFMVQFAVLAWSHEIPDLTRWTDNVRILECLEDAGVISSEDVGFLTSAYKNYRSVGHRLQLQKLPVVVNTAELAVERAQVSADWQRLLGGS